MQSKEVGETRAIHWTSQRNLEEKKIQQSQEGKKKEEKLERLAGMKGERYRGFRLWLVMA